MKIAEEKSGATVALVNKGFSLRSVSKKLCFNFSTIQKVMVSYNLVSRNRISFMMKCWKKKNDKIQGSSNQMCE